MVQKYLEGACTSGQDSPYMNSLCLSDEGGQQVDFNLALQNLSKAVDWALGDLKKFLASLQQAIGKSLKGLDP